MNEDFAPVWDEPAQTRHHGAALQRSPGNSPATTRKKIVTIRLDIDTLGWFKSAGPGYQTRINELLRQHMEAERAKAAGGEDEAA